MVQASPQEGSSYTKLHSLTLDQNICRVVKIGSPNRYLLASYHLDKSTQKKSGKLYTVEVNG